MSRIKWQQKTSIRDSTVHFKSISNKSLFLPNDLYLPLSAAMHVAQWSSHITNLWTFSSSHRTTNGGEYISSDRMLSNSEAFTIFQWKNLNALQQQKTELKWDFLCISSSVFSNYLDRSRTTCVVVYNWHWVVGAGCCQNFWNSLLVLFGLSCRQNLHTTARDSLSINLSSPAFSIPFHHVSCGMSYS